MRTDEKAQDHLAHAREKYRVQLTRAILALLGRRFDLEDDMYGLEEDYKVRLPQTPLVLITRHRGDGYLAGLYWGFVIRPIYTDRDFAASGKRPFIRHLPKLEDKHIHKIARNDAAAARYRKFDRHARELMDARKPVMRALASIQRILRSRYQPVEGMPGGDSLIRECYRERVSKMFADACECGLGLVERLAQAEVALLDLTRRYQAQPADPGWTLAFVAARQARAAAQARWEFFTEGRIVTRVKLSHRELRALKVPARARKPLLAWEAERRRLDRARKRDLEALRRIVGVARAVVRREAA